MRLVNAVARGLDVLEVLLEDPGPLSMSEIGQRVDIPRSTLHEIVHTLTVRGYLEVRGDGFVLGLRLFELGNVYRARLDLAAIGRDEALQLTTITGETSQVAIRDGVDVVYIAKVEGADMLRLVSEVGRRLPATCTGVGKAMLAGLSRQQVSDLFASDADVVAMTPHSVSSRDALHDELAVTRARGYAFDDCESNIAVRCIAAPIVNASGQAVAAISVSAPTVRWTTDLERQLAELVPQAAARLSHRIGGVAFTSSPSPAPSSLAVN